MVVISQGPRMAKAAAPASSFGTKARVISLIWVAAWKILITRPTTSTVSSSGAAIFSATSMAWWIMVMTVMEVMEGLLQVEAARQRTEQQVADVGQHEEHQLEGQGDGHRWNHHHPERHQDAGHDQIDDQEGNEDGEADLKCRLQFAGDEGGNQHAHGHLVG